MTLIEKKTVVNLLEAYAVAVKHYLRGEDGIHYEDLYPLVPFRHSRYPFPAIIPPADLRNRRPNVFRPPYIAASPESTLRVPAAQPISASNQIPLETASGAYSPLVERTTSDASQCSNDLESQCGKPLPAELPPKHCWRTAFPFPLLNRVWTVIREDVGKNAHQEKPKRKNNVPLEISLYLVRMSYYLWKISKLHFSQRLLTYPHCNPVKSWRIQL
jgi:putative membrane protein